MEFIAANPTLIDTAAAFVRDMGLGHSMIAGAVILGALLRL